MKRAIYAVLFALILTAGLLSSCGERDRDDINITDTAPTVEDIQPTVPPQAAEDLSDDEIIIIDDGEELRYNVDGVKLIEDGYVYRQCWLSNGEINAVLDILSDIDISKYETVDWKTEDVPAEGYWMHFVIVADGEVHRVTPHWCLSIDGIGYKWEHDENHHALYSLAKQIRDRHEDWSDVTDDSETVAEITSNDISDEIEPLNEERVLDDEELRYDVISVRCFGNGVMVTQFVSEPREYDFLLTNSEINEFLDALSAVDFSDNGAQRAGSPFEAFTVVTEEENWTVTTAGDILTLWPDDSFSLEARREIVTHACSEEEMEKLSLFLEKIEEYKRSLLKK